MQTYSQTPLLSSTINTIKVYNRQIRNIQKMNINDIKAYTTIIQKKMNYKTKIY